MRLASWKLETTLLYFVCICMPFPCSWEQGQSLLCAVLLCAWTTPGRSLVSPAVAQCCLSCREIKWMATWSWSLEVGCGDGRAQKNPGSRSQVFQGLGKTMLCFDPCRKRLLTYFKMLFKMSVWHLVSAQGVYLFCFKASHVLKVMLKLNPHD